MNRDRIAKLLPRLASDHDGEVIATVAAIRRTLEAEGDDLHDLARSIGGTTSVEVISRLLDHWIDSAAIETNRRMIAEREAERLRDELAVARKALAAAARPEAPRWRAKATQAAKELAEAVKDRDATGERLHAATNENVRLRSEISELIGKPRGSLPPSWDRCSPIERAATIEAWAHDDGMTATDRRWAARFAAALEERAPVDPRDVRRFNALLRSRPAQN